MGFRFRNQRIGFRIWVEGEVFGGVRTKFKCVVVLTSKPKPLNFWNPQHSDPKP